MKGKTNCFLHKHNNGKFYICTKRCLNNTKLITLKMIKLNNIYFNAPELEEVFCRNYKPNLTNGNTKIYSFKNDKLLHKLFKNTNIDEELMEIPQNDIDIKMKKIRNDMNKLTLSNSVKLNTFGNTDSILKRNEVFNKEFVKGKTVDNMKDFNKKYDKYL